MPPLWALHAIPFFLLGLILIYLFAFRFPRASDVRRLQRRRLPGPDRARSSLDVIRHAILPALSIILVATGGWALAMRGMMVTTQGEDYVTFAEAKGLRSSTIFLRYCVRNALLPQTTALALALGQIVSGAVLVEVIFGYPGIGTRPVPGDPGERPLPDPGHRVHRDRRARPRDAAPRRALSLARSAHHLPEGVRRRDRSGLGARHRLARRSACPPRCATCAATSRWSSGSILLGALAAFVGIGHLVVDTAKARPLSAPTLQPPSCAYPARHRPAGPRPPRRRWSPARR